MKITLEIPDSIVEETVKGIMENFPEASQGSVLKCVGWKYEADSLSDWTFIFLDEETRDETKLDKALLLAAFPLLFTDKWPKGCTPVPMNGFEDSEVWDDWLCSCDATDFDAYVQLVIFGEVIYG